MRHSDAIASTRPGAQPRSAMTTSAAMLCSALLATTLAGCGGGNTTVTIGSGDFQVNVRPAFLGNVASTTYDGTADDLLTAGLGRAGLAVAAPAVSSPPTAAELRRLAIYNNYRAILDITANGGYGTLYGPNVAPGTNAPGTGDGRIAGTELIAFADDGSGRQNVTLMVQIPTTFNPAQACIVTATSSGSRGVYGAIGSAGEWGLKRGCAVAYSDKGTGNGLHDLQANTVTQIDGRRTTAAAAGSGSNFTARLTDAERTEFNTATPSRFAVKHAHSEQNPEKDWGLHTLQAVEFAFWALNERFGTVLADGRRTITIRPANTIVIASSVSNGGAAALAAAEQDTAGLIDGVAVSEPQVQIAPSATLRIERAGLPAYTAGSRPLFDYTSYAHLLQPCAALATGVGAAAPFGWALGSASAVLAANRCAALAGAGLVTGITTQAQADDALARLRAYGWEPESDLLQTSHWSFATPAIAVTYANTYGRFRVNDNLCGYSFGAVGTDGRPVAAAAAAVDNFFGTGNGVPPSGAIQLIWNGAAGGPINHGAATSPSTGTPDYGFDAARCIRELWTGTGANAQRVRAGVAEVYRTANLRGKPAIIVHGRADTLVPANLSSRPYVLQNAIVEGSASRLRYVEVLNAQHFDSFLGFPGYDTRFVPLHRYFVQAMDLMWEHLRSGAALPPSQVVRTTPRGGTPGAAPAITPANVPPIAATPAAGDLVTVQGSTLRVPN